ncbi:MAG: methyltransferase domain-containing protein [Hyphomicrobiales bacterium]|nr:methyltransferase domain-containing protein [Hyphomicrobiales bacterium]
MSRESITAGFVEHYSGKIREHGPNAKGVDWVHEDRAELRQDMMLKVVTEQDRAESVSLLDVGCGYGALLTRAHALELKLDYTGNDLVGDMITHARALHPDSLFVAGDFLETEWHETYDYVVCNGIMTFKHHASLLDMEKYCFALMTKMFQLARKGIAFNMMSSRVNFFDPKLFYRNPIEILSFCQTNLSSKLRLENAYLPFEFTVHVYHP